MKERALTEPGKVRKLASSCKEFVKDERSTVAAIITGSAGVYELTQQNYSLAAVFGSITAVSVTNDFFQRRRDRRKAFLEGLNQGKETR